MVSVLGVGTLMPNVIPFVVGLRCKRRRSADKPTERRDGQNGTGSRLLDGMDEHHIRTDPVRKSACLGSCSHPSASIFGSS
jgi:predicted metal-binding protein